MTDYFEAEVAVAKLALLQNALKQLPITLQRKIIREETRKASKQHMLHRAKYSVPRRTGRLRRAIAVRAIKRSRVAAGVRTAMSSHKFKGDAFYGGFLEYGWRVGKRSRTILYLQRLKSRAKTNERKSEIQAQIESADTRPKIEPKKWMQDIAKMFGPRAVEQSANEIGKRIVEEMKKGG